MEAFSIAWEDLSRAKATVCSTCVSALLCASDKVLSLYCSNQVMPQIIDLNLINWLTRLGTFDAQRICFLKNAIAKSLQ
jgi:hypothetical protein